MGTASWRSALMVSAPRHLTSTVTVTVGASRAGLHAMHAMVHTRTQTSVESGRIARTIASL